MMEMFVPFWAMVKKEFLVQLRRARSFWCLLLLLLPIAWAVAGIWPRQQNLVWAEMPMISMIAMIYGSFTLLVGGALFLPGVAGTTVVVEKERGCWEALTLTLTRPSAIVLAKLLGATGLYLIFIIAALPIIGSVFFLVGIDWTQWLWSMVIILTTSISCGAVGLACSAHFRATTSALATSYMLMTMVMGMPLLIAATVMAFLSMIFGINTFSWLGSYPFWIGLSPLMVLTQFTGGFFGGGAPGVVSVMGTHLMYQAAITGVALLSAWISVRRPTEPFVEEVSSKWWRRRRKKDGKRGRGGNRAQSHPPIGDRLNPMLAKEMRWSTALQGRRRGRFMFLSFLLFFGISCALSYGLSESGVRDVQGFAFTSILLHGALIAYFIPTRIAAVFTREHEQENFDMLRMTLLKPGEIVGGKFRAGLHIIFALMLSSVAGNFFLWRDALLYGRGNEAFKVLVTGHISIFVCALVALTVTIWASIIAKRTATAIVMSYGLVVMAFGGVLFIVMMAMVQARIPEEVWKFCVTVLSPVSGYIYAVVEGREFNDAAWMVNIVVFTLGSFFLYLTAVAFFRKFRMRDR